MAVPFSIRRATVEDYDSISAILEEADAIHYVSEPTYFQPASLARRSREYVQQWLESEESTIYVAEVYGRIIGVLFLLIRATPDISVLKPRRWVNVDILAVKEGWRSQGIGHALLATSEDWARSHGIKEIELSVWSFNQRALALYEKTGFRTLRYYMGKQIK